MKPSRVGGLWAQRQREGTEAPPKPPKPVRAKKKENPVILNKTEYLTGLTPQRRAVITGDPIPLSRPTGKGVPDATIKEALQRLYLETHSRLKLFSEITLRTLTTPELVKEAFKIKGKNAKAIAGMIRRFNSQRSKE